MANDRRTSNSSRSYSDWDDSASQGGSQRRTTQRSTSRYSDSDRYSDAGRYSDTSRYSNTNRYADSSRYADTSQYSSTNRYANSSQYPDAGRYADTGQYSGTSRYSNSSQYSNTGRYSDSNRYSDADRYADTNRYRSSSRQSAQRSTSRQTSRTTSSGGRRQTTTRSRATSQARQLDTAILRNRIIAIVIIVAAIALIVGLVSCAVKAIGQSNQAGSAMSVNAGNSAATQTGASNASSSASADSASSAAAATEGGVEDRWVEGGRFTTGDAELDEMVKAYCDANSDPSISVSDNAFNTYTAIVWSEYVENDNNQTPTGADWDIQYAKQFFRNNEGNCYEYCAAVSFALKYFGYKDVYAVPCLVLRQSGDYGDHGLAFATDFDGRKCLCDSAFGANGWLIDADSYTMQVLDVGQDPAVFTIADFEEVVTPSWLR